MEGPPARIVRVERDNDLPHRSDEDCIPHGAGNPHPVNLHDLELVPVQVHRVRHHRLVREYKFDPLTFGNGERGHILRPDDIVDRPDIFRHVAGQIEPVRPVCLTAT